MAYIKKKTCSIFLLLFSMFCFGQKPELKISTGYNNTSWIRSIVYSQDGKYILTSSDQEKNGIKIFDFETCKEIRTIKTFSSSAQITHNNKYLINSHFNGSQKPISFIYDVATGDEIFKLQGNILKLSNDNKYVATANYEDQINIYELSTGNLINTFLYSLNLVFVSDIEFNDDNTRIAVSGPDTNSPGIGIKTYIYDIINGSQLTEIDGSSPQYSTDGKYICTINIEDRKVFVYEIKKIDSFAEVEFKDGELVPNGIVGKLEVPITQLELSRTFSGFTAKFSNDNKHICVGNDKIIDAATDTNISIYDLTSGIKIKSFMGDDVNGINFSPNNHYLSVSHWNKGVDLFDLNTNKKINNFKGSIAAFSPDNNYITTGDLNTTQTYNIKTGKLLKENWLDSNITESKLSLDSNYYLVTTFLNGYETNTYSIYDLFTLNKKDYKVDNFIKEKQSYIPNITLSSDSKYFVKENDFNDKNDVYDEVRIYDIKNGKIKQNLPSFDYNFEKFYFSPNNKYLVGLLNFGWGGIIYDIETGLKIRELDLKDIHINNICFSPDSNFIALSCSDGTSKIFDIHSSKQIFTLETNNEDVDNSFYSTDGNFILVISSNSGSAKNYEKSIPNSAKVFYAKTGLEKYTITSHKRCVNYASFSNDGKYIVTASDDGTSIVTELFSGKTIFILKSPHDKRVLFAKFSDNDKYIATIGDDNKIDYWDAKTGKYLFTRFFLTNDNYLDYDQNYRFDGTSTAIKNLYLVCGMEIIDLTQVKESLYQPNLVTRILNGENIDHLPKLDDIEICGVSPLIEPLDKKDGKFYYKIIPRKGGVGDIDLYINNILRETINSTSLKLIDGNYEIKISDDLINENKIQGEEFSISVVAKTKINGINSREVVSVVVEKSDKIHQRKPKIFAIMIGIDNYRGEGLDLNYASKDAIDLQKAMELSAQKLFNFDGSNKVHFFSLVNKKDGTIIGITPDRNNILATIDKVEKESNPEDIFLIFFAGHGALIENKLILLTSEASKEQAPNFSGISTQEILEKLSKIKAGKRILFLDACHSGAAINDLGVKSLVGQRDIEDLTSKSQRDKELDRIANKSGLAIITASSSDQVANELPQYEHGLLTYSLLKTMLSEPNSLDKDNQLQLEDWLRETEKMVGKLIEDQTTQKFVPLNYSIGKIDDEVRKLVILHEVPMLYLESVININLGSDDIHLGIELRNQMNSISSRGVEQKVIISEKLSSTSDLIRVLYSINKNEISCSVILLKNEIIKKKLEIKGENSKEGIKALSEKIMLQILKTYKEK
jgi:WD40 repeat protein